MIVKSPSIQTRMTSMGIWSLEGTPGILEVFTNVKNPALEDQEEGGDEATGSISPLYKRAEVATKLLETLENFNYDDTEEERSDAYFSGWLDSDEKVIDLPIFEDFQTLPPSTTSPTSSIPPPPPLVSITRSNNVANAGFNQGHVKVGYESSPLWNADYPTSLYSPPAVPEPAHTTVNSGAWSPHTMDQLVGVSCTLTPPTSPHMYSPKRREEIQKYDDFLTVEPLVTPTAAAVAVEKESGQLILSLLAEMNQSEIDEIMKNQFEAGVGVGGAVENGGGDESVSSNDAAVDFDMAEEGTYGSNGFNSNTQEQLNEVSSHGLNLGNANEVIYGGRVGGGISPVDSPCSLLSIDSFTTGGKSLPVASYEETAAGGVCSPLAGINDSSCHSFSEASSSISGPGDYGSESSDMSDPDYSPYSPVRTVAADKGGRKAALKIVSSGRSVTGARNGVGAQASTAGRKEPTTTKRSRGSATAKPYTRKSVAPEDKKLRKKEQNKNAATRYRIKKKQEVEVILGEEKGLEDKNIALVKQVEDLQREISFMKKFMRDFFKTQGRLK